MLSQHLLRISSCIVTLPKLQQQLPSLYHLVNYCTLAKFTTHLLFCTIQIQPVFCLPLNILVSI